MSTNFQPPKPQSDPLNSLATAATVLIILGSVLAAVGVIGGIAVALIEDDSESLFDPSYPYVGLGLAIIAAGIVVPAVLIFLGLWAKAWLHLRRPDQGSARVA